MPTTERALSRRPVRARSALGPVSRPGRDLVVLVVVLVAVAGLVRLRSGVEYAVPVSVGNNTIENSAEVLAAGEERLQELAESRGGRIAEDAGCYFWRPMGATQGAQAADMFGSLMPGMADAEGVDLILCGPAEISSGFLEGMAQEPWVPGLVSYVVGSSPGSYRGELQQLLPAPLPVLTATGGVEADTLLAADGRSPDGDDIEDPTWVEVEGSGEGGSGGGLELPPDMSLPEIPDLPQLPDLGQATP